MEQVGHDNGSEFRAGCEKLGIQQYHSRVRTPKDNATNERFNRHLERVPPLRQPQGRRGAVQPQASPVTPRVQRPPAAPDAWARVTDVIHPAARARDTELVILYIQCRPDVKSSGGREVNGSAPAATLLGMSILIPMSPKEAKKLEIVRDIRHGGLTQQEAAQLLVSPSRSRLHPPRLQSSFRRLWRPSERRIRSFQFQGKADEFMARRYSILADSILAGVGSTSTCPVF